MGLTRQPLPAIAWIFDFGAEKAFPVCLFSIQQASPGLFEHAPLIVVDCGISDSMRTWMLSLRRSNLHIISAKLPESTSVMGGDSSRAASVMRLRIELPQLLTASIADALIPEFETFLQLDTDTVFLSDPTSRLTEPWAGEDIRCCYEWDWVGEPRDDQQTFMKFVRPSSFAVADYVEKLPQVADALGLSLGELRTVPTVNSGVWMARTQGRLSEGWRDQYDGLRKLDATLGMGFLNPFSSEQNALSLAIYLGAVTPRFMPRRMNNLPPKAPHHWPADVCIAHFISMGKNWHRGAYRLWSDFRKRAISCGFAPASLLMPHLPDPLQYGS